MMIGYVILSLFICLFHVWETVDQKKMWKKFNNGNIIQDKNSNNQWFICKWFQSSISIVTDVMICKHMYLVKYVLDICMVDVSWPFNQLVVYLEFKTTWKSLSMSKVNIYCKLSVVKRKPETNNLLFIKALAQDERPCGKLKGSYCSF